MENDRLRIYKMINSFVLILVRVISHIGDLNECSKNVKKDMRLKFMNVADVLIQTVNLTNEKEKCSNPTTNAVCNTI